jgi:hypothetical protein
MVEVQVQVQVEEHQHVLGQLNQAEELKKIHVPELEDPRSVPFNVDVAYATGGGTPHGR